MQNNSTYIYGTRINLRSITPDDTAYIVKWRNSPCVQKYFIYREKITAESHMKYFKENIETGKIKQFVIVEKSTETPIGCVYLRDIDLQNDNAEFGIFIGEKEYRGKGFGKESAQLICKYAFEELNLHKIMLRVLPFNAIAVKMYEIIGFKQEANLKEHAKIDGKYEDVILMGLLR